MRIIPDLANPVSAKVLKTVRETGISGLLRVILRKLFQSVARPLSPNIHPVLYGGIPVGERKLVDDWFPGFAALDLQHIPDYEAALVCALVDYITPRDRIVVVGAGLGVTASVAAFRTGPGGEVIVFEGGLEAMKVTRATIKRNGLGEIVTLVHAIIGAEYAVYGTRSKHGIVSPTELPECDLLELDCEGAEATILREMTISPRICLVETHGIYGAPSETVERLLRERGYKVTDRGVAEPRLRAYCELNDIRVLAAELEM